MTALTPTTGRTVRTRFGTFHFPAGGTVSLAFAALATAASGVGPRPRADFHDHGRLAA